MNRELIGKAVALLVSYREYTGDCRIANVCGEIIEALKAELAKPEQPDLRKAAEMALEVLERGTTGLAIRAIPALRQALAQPEQEPVAWDNTDGASFADFARAIETKLRERNEN